MNSEQVAGARAYDEGKVAVLAGLAAGAGMVLSQGLAALASAQMLIWGVALPMTAAGIATHYLTWLRARWAAFWQQSEQSRFMPHPPCCLLSHLLRLLICSFLNFTNEYHRSMLTSGTHWMLRWLP